MIIAQSLKIGNLTLKNRFVMSAMASGYPELSGEPNERFISYLERRAIGGVAMIIVESTGVLENFRYNVRTPSIANDSTIPSWTRLANRIHEKDALVCVQLQHPGRQVYDVTVGDIVSASNLPTLVTKVVPRALTLEEIKEYAEKFGDGAYRAKQAGIDAIEIHAGHGYLFSQFLSTSSNTRTDQYGGDLENRFRFLKETIESTQSKVGKDYPILVRLSFEEFTGEGISLDETLQVAKWLEMMGIVSIRVSGGSLDQKIPAMIPPTDVQKGLFWEFSKIAKQTLNIPVDIVGRIQSPQLAEELLQEDYADYISLGRPLIADPDFVNKALNTDEQLPIRPCIACNQGCIDRLLNADIGEVSCLVNPKVGTEWNTPLEIEGADKKKYKILVVGAGPAGLEAARVAASNGHEVTIFEKEDTIGGTFRKATLPPGKQDFKALLTYYELEIKRLNILLRLGQEVNKELLTENNPDYVFWAIGSEKTSSAELTSTTSLLCEEIYSTSLEKNLNILIYGGRWEGVETALYLNALGHNVTLIDEQVKLGELLSPVTRRWYLRKKLKENNIPFYESVSNVQFQSNEAVFTIKDNSTLKNKFDLLVLESTKKPNKNIIEGNYQNIVIGDAKNPRNALFAIHEGNYFAENFDKILNYNK
ncbi:oxidoreductase [Peribacillus frigoritolerans]|uniref:oxidoreductase n=1 Tax=Peribacillus frigoritolerans TaxID=450367 RepID=UPI003F7ED3BF